MTTPKAIEKELFAVVVHASQFTVSARRIHSLLHPDQLYEIWMQVSILKALLKEGTDYRYRSRAVDMLKRRHHHGIVFNLYAVRKLCGLYIRSAAATEEQEITARKLFYEVSMKRGAMV